MLERPITQDGPADDHDDPFLLEEMVPDRRGGGAPVTSMTGLTSVLRWRTGDTPYAALAQYSLTRRDL
ncbi:hypothetical protein CH063_03594 [Colletotrichum higginsianum]|uniref:Uncharacterized protein n=1 Tax=Colletotrichum higginsianum (strain IMI 349063) TaxID=759273 RepID=H1VYU3_COLHI|nr:hypothetical protein CH063_03594 [Colletotrichum higginsianum]